jgi:hypothetical protein
MHVMHCDMYFIEAAGAWLVQECSVDAEKESEKSIAV